MNRHLRITNLPTTFYGYLKTMRGFERMNRHFGITNILTAFYRCLRRMPVFESLWQSYRTSYSEMSLIEGSAASLQGIYAITLLRNGGHSA
jgi:hypothetical protein